MKHKKRGLALLLMLTLALLGSAFFALTYSYAIDERSEQMQSKATVVSHMVSSYMENGSLTGLRELADFASNVTDAEFLICNSDGNLLLTTDTTLVNRVLTVPQDVAEGAMSVEEAAMKKKERAVFREETGFTGVANRIAKQLEEMVGVEARAVVPGHVQRGGSPSAYDRMLSTVFGVHAAQLIAAENYGQAVAMVGNTVSHNPLSEVAGKTKFVPADAQAVRAARSMGISLGD